MVDGWTELRTEQQMGVWVMESCEMGCVENAGMGRPAAEPTAAAAVCSHSVTALGELLRLLSVAVRPPTETMARAVADGSLAGAVLGACAELEVEGAPVEVFSAVAGSYAGLETQDVLHALRRAHTRLFLGSAPLVENAEGPWRKKAEGKEGVALMVNSYSTEVADFMRFCGVVRSSGYNDCVDYIENELDFAGFLADGPEYLAAHGLDAGELLGRFVDEHLKLWVPGFCRDVAAADVPTDGRAGAGGYYAAVCGLIDAVVGQL